MTKVSLYDLDSNKTEDAALDEDFGRAKKYGHASVGKLAVYFKDGIKRKAVRLSETYRIFTRIREIKTHMCCGKLDLFIYGLVLSKDGRELAEIKSESEKHINLATEEILIQRNEISTGYEGK